MYNKDYFEQFNQSVALRLLTMLTRDYLLIEQNDQSCHELTLPIRLFCLALKGTVTDSVWALGLAVKIGDKLVSIDIKMVLLESHKEEYNYMHCSKFCEKTNKQKTGVYWQKRPQSATLM